MVFSFGQPLGRRLNRLDDVHIASAPAEVSRNGLADFELGRLLVAGQECGAGHHHPRRAVAALQPVLLPETFLNGVKLPVLLQALDGGELVAVGLDGKHGAGLHRLSVEENGAGAAVGGVAANVRPGQPEIFPKEVHQQQARFHFSLVLHSIDRHLD
jgi:hypothetical protein